MSDAHVIIQSLYYFITCIYQYLFRHCWWTCWGLCSCLNSSCSMRGTLGDLLLGHRLCAFQTLLGKANFLIHQHIMLTAVLEFPLFFKVVFPFQDITVDNFFTPFHWIAVLSISFLIYGNIYTHIYNTNIHDTVCAYIHMILILFTLLFTFLN